MKSKCKHPNLCVVPIGRGCGGSHVKEEYNYFFYNWCPDCGYIKKLKVYENEGMKIKTRRIKL